MRRVRVLPRSHTDLSFDIWPPDPQTNQVIAIAKNVNIIVDGLENFGSVDVESDNVVIWTEGGFENNPNGQEQEQRPAARDLHGRQRRLPPGSSGRSMPSGCTTTSAAKWASCWTPK